MNARRIGVFGATGSIGASALDVIERHPERFDVAVLTANDKVDDLLRLCERFRPAAAVIAEPAHYRALSDGLRSAGLQTQAHAGPDALSELAGSDLCDTVIAAIVGAAGLASTLAAARAGKRILLANKEAIVIAGALLMQEIARHGGEIIPIDSEHNAIFQCLPSPALGAAARPGVRRILLTASGGPFRGWSRDQLVDVTPEQACAHPNWSMGRKISVDSATLMNKGLEVIEARWLFDAAPASIEVVVHPQSIVHSLVEYADGSVLAQLGNPDMRTALAHGLAWPERIDAGVARLDLTALARLEFEVPDRVAFPCLDLAFRALRSGPEAATVLNAANEIAVSAFLQRQLRFLAIAEVLARTMDELESESATSLPALMELDGEARKIARARISNMN